MGEFEIELDEIERERDTPFDPEAYKVSFTVERDGRAFRIAVWIEVGTVPTTDLIRHAMGEMHGVLKQLAEQTAAWRLGT